MKNKLMGRHTHDVHASQLTPDLHEETNDGSVDHVRPEQLQVADVGVLALKLDHFTDLGHFTVYEGRIRVAMAVDKIQHLLGLLPAVLAGKPTRRLG